MECKKHNSGPIDVWYDCWDCLEADRDFKITITSKNITIMKHVYRLVDQVSGFDEQCRISISDREIELN